MADSNKAVKKAVRNARDVYVDALVMEDATPVKVAKSEILRILKSQPEDCPLWNVIDFNDGDILLSN